MVSTIRCLFVFALAFVASGSSRAGDEPLAKEEIARIGKAATGLVEVKYGLQATYGSAFCIHPSGLFLTNEHLLRSPFGMAFNQNAGPLAEEVTLVLNPGQKGEKVYKAKVVRSDKDLDLALLRIEGGKGLPVLALGSDEKLSELAEVVAVGFPFGTILVPNRKENKEYPAVSINKGSITALRHQDDRLHRIQLDAQLNPGNSGGPVLDSSGKVVGMVVSGIQGSGVNMAIPVNHLQRFLAKPEVILTLPAVKATNRHEPFEFTAKTISLLPSNETLDLELILVAGSGKERRFPMKLVDGVYRAKAVPFPTREGPSVCRVEVKYEDGSVSGTVEDRTIRFGGRELKLSQARLLRQVPKSEAKLVDGQRPEAKPDEFSTLTLQVGKQSLQIDLANAVEVKVEAPEEVTVLSCTVLARQAAREVGRNSVPLYVEGLSRPSLEALAEGKFVKPARSGVPVTYLRAVSSKGDFIGQGQNYSYAGNDLTFQTNNRGVTVNAGGFGGWMLHFGGPGNRFLDVGEYDGAKRFPFSGDAPGIEFSGNGRGANRIAGKFVVWEIEVKGNQVVHLAIDFIQRCEETQPPLYGTLRINSSFH